MHLLREVLREVLGEVLREVLGEVLREVFKAKNPLFIGVQSYWREVLRHLYFIRINSSFAFAQRLETSMQLDGDIYATWQQ